MGMLIWDLRYGFRMLRKSPGFTVVAVLTLALGIGATTAIFTLIQQVMLRSLPVVRPDQLWRIGDSDRCCYSDGYTQEKSLPENSWTFFSLEAYKHFRANTAAFENLAAFQVGEANAHLTVRRAGSSALAEPRNGEYVSGNFFETFGLSAWRGRLFTEADDQEAAPPVAVMSFHVWREKYGSDPSVSGATYQINGHLFTVIGVAPPGFFGAKIDGNMPDFWLPLVTEPLIAGATSRLKNPRLAWLDLIGRIRPGTIPESLEAQLHVELHQWLASHVPDMTPQEKALLPKQTLRLTPGGGGVSPMRAHYKDGLRLLLLAAVCVLLVACANVANLLLARGLKDRQQTAIRVTLGAPRSRLFRKALIESLSLAMIGGAAGISVAYMGAALVLHLAFGPDISGPVNANPSGPVLLFALGISLVTGLIFGIVPAWMATASTSHAERFVGTRGASRAAGNNRRVLGAQKMLVIVQAAVSTVLLSLAALLGQSLRNLEHQDFGFNSHGRYVVSINPKLSNYKQERLAPLFGEIEDQLRLIPGVRVAGSVLAAPLTSWVWPHEIRVEGKPEPGPQEDVSSGWTRVTPGFFETLGDRIVMGRSITAEDDASTRPVAVINESFAKRFFGKENPIGQHFGGPAPRENAGLYEIVGVASDVTFGEEPQPMYFLPEAQNTSFLDAEAEEREILSHYLGNVLIWAPDKLANVEEQVKRALANVDANLVMEDVQPYSEVIHDRFHQQNTIESLTWLFGALALLLAAVGLYGVTAYGVEQRTREIGVRMSLGAGRGSVLLMVLREACWQVGIGLALGIPAAIAAGYLIADRLFGVKPWDPLMLSVATLLLGLAALIAAVIPARRATLVEPMAALRHD